MYTIRHLCATGGIGVVRFTTVRYLVRYIFYRRCACVRTHTHKHTRMHAHTKNNEFKCIIQVCLYIIVYALVRHGRATFFIYAINLRRYPKWNTRTVYYSKIRRRTIGKMFSNIPNAIFNLKNKTQ